MLPLVAVPPALRIAVSARSSARAMNATSWKRLSKAGDGFETVMTAKLMMQILFDHYVDDYRRRAASWSCARRCSAKLIFSKPGMLVVSGATRCCCENDAAPWELI